MKTQVTAWLADRAKQTREIIHPQRSNVNSNKRERERDRETETEREREREKGTQSGAFDET